MFFFFLLSELEESNHDHQLMGRAGKPHEPFLLYLEVVCQFNTNKCILNEIVTRAKFESITNRMTFEYAPNIIIVKVHPLYLFYL